MQRYRMPRITTARAWIAIGSFALALTAPMAFAAAGAKANAKATSGESMQPVSDSWITAKVKADLLVHDETKGLDINVSTRNGKVTLAGRLDTMAQVETAVAIASAIKGVTAVDASTLTVKPKG